ncbi:membrane protein, putative [Geotalea daltonii FRC-32]|uniref:Membrane protein, putative n=1 Tax=Geotalea daltonii (strain DSM 22248 / JCM 15807 / FRC-32) TaxID=316067 RepID=B9M583_GEODF|nr:FUSC family protein [Geotalea daltonii]ACM19838.1 membrane protein, putative [Geotalea daltonii FRC-32]
MNSRKKDLLVLGALLVLLILFFSKILFTDKIIRAPDIMNEFYWGVEWVKKGDFWSLFNVDLHAAWDKFVNGGTTDEGGGVSNQFLIYRSLILYLFPAPSCVAWFIVFQLFFGAAGTYCYCRLIGVGRLGSFLGGLIFAVAPENASLINAGHVMKIATISFAPWAFYFFEKGFLSRRVFFFLATAVVLALQFFNTHWQVAYYTCLGIGIYGIIRSIGILVHESQDGKRDMARLLGLNLVTMLFFLSTVAISLVPLSNWAKDTNRGVHSGANQGKGGLDREEAMSWSMPPEEVTAFVIPGAFGISRQEAGANPANISAYYWGRMVFTQTLTYMGLLPWLLLPLPLLFRRDKYTWLALCAIVGGILFSMGKYTPVYQILYDYFPGIDRFRVPKMMMFLPVFGLGVIAARGMDCILDRDVRDSRIFKRYAMGVLAVPVVLLVLLVVETLGKEYWISTFHEMLAQPTRYESGADLIVRRWRNLVNETAIAAMLAGLSAAVICLAAFGKNSMRYVPILLVALYLADVGRIDNKFMFLVNVPEKVKGAKTPAIEYLIKANKGNRVLPMDGSDPMQYVANKIPVMFTSNPVQKKRWQDFLEVFSLGSPLPDLMNVQYLILSQEQYLQEKNQLSAKYLPVYESPDGSQVVLENRQVFPKGWLVSSVLTLPDPQQRLMVLNNPSVDLRTVAIVESPPPVSLAGPVPADGPVGEVNVTGNSGEELTVISHVTRNSLLVLGEKYDKGWKATVDGKETEIYPVNHVLRGIYLTPGKHTVEMRFDPLPFKIGKYLTLASFAFFILMLARELFLQQKGPHRGLQQ